jgi:hypothetical protein
MKADREKWILSWFADHPNQSTDVLNSNFVDAYVEATNAPCKVFFYGAMQCRQLGRDLASMFRKGLLERSTVGLQPGDSAMGFPKWVYCYRLKSPQNICQTYPTNDNKEVI